MDLTRSHFPSLTMEPPDRWSPERELLLAADLSEGLARLTSINQFTMNRD
jgi:hypothetical protein